MTTLLRPVPGNSGPVHLRRQSGPSSAALDEPKAPLVTRRRLQIALGSLWLLDGALQLQPYMFTLGFAHNIIAPAGVGQPLFVGGAVRWSAALIATHPAVYDALFATVQLALGVGLLVPRTMRLALALSVLWAVGVWYFGEGLGGVLGGNASILNGAPGAALLYGVLAVAAWPRSHLDDGGAEPPPLWTLRAWTLLWIGFASLVLLPANESAKGIAAPIVANITTVPAPLASVDRLAGSTVHAFGPLAVPLFVIVMAGIGILSLPGGRWRVVAVWVGCGLALVVWVTGQAFGQLGSGQATDPNAAPLVFLLGLVALSAGRHRRAAPSKAVRVRNEGDPLSRSTPSRRWPTQTLT
jgi:hypothetical protein